ncbi:MAG: DUF4163 domain-containing protein [Syntrophomonadaceae bacterium]|jgi:hypothetical protein|nr:DUF4163 domain-containing protein [Syntrophomonadaceae bacterium]
MKKIIALMLTAVFLLIAPIAIQAQVSNQVFIDTKGHWAESEIDLAYNQGLMQGMGVDQYGSRLFSPEAYANRFQLAVVMDRVFDLDYGNIRFIKEPSVTDYYYDVEDGEWYSQALLLGAVNHILLPVDAFKGSQSVSRIELATTVYRAFNAKGISVPMIMLMPIYDDTGDLSQEESNAMVFVSNTGLMKGNEKLFRPYDPIKRGELAKVLNGCVDLMKYNPAQTSPDMDIRVEAKTIEKSLELIDIDMHIPVFSGLPNEEVQKQLNQFFEQEALDRQEVMMAEAQSMSEYILTEPYHTYALVSRYYKYGVYQDILSFYVDYYSYTGGAHGLTERKAYNFNINTGEEISLSEFFLEDYDYKDMINKTIQEVIDQNPDQYFPAEYGFQGISEDQGFYLENNSLVIFFQQYEVAPYAAGIRGFAVPYRK